MSYITPVSKKQLTKILNSRLNPHLCPECGGGVEITIALPVYGAQSIKVQCRHCGNAVTSSQLHELFGTDTSLAMPITFRSFSRAVFRAISEWNRQTLKKENAAQRIERQQTNFIGSAKPIRLLYQNVV